MWTGGETGTHEDKDEVGKGLGIGHWRLALNLAGWAMEWSLRDACAWF